MSSLLLKTTLSGDFACLCHYLKENDYCKPQTDPGSLKVDQPVLDVLLNNRIADLVKENVSSYKTSRWTTKNFYF